MKTIKNKILALLVIFALISCDNNDADENPSGNDLSTQLTARALKTLDNSSWVFKNYTKNKIGADFENRITLEFETTTNEQLSYFGRNLVNSYFGSFAVQEGTGLIAENQDIGSTLIGSLDEETASIEQEYFANLGKATYFKIKDAILYIYLGDTTDSETEIMVFTWN